MEILLDTHVLLWALFDDQKINKKIRELLLDSNNDVFYSIASIHEIEIKHLKHPELMPYSAKDIINVIVGKTDYKMLPIRIEYILGLKEVFDENKHQDPFDHMIIATARNEGMALVTHDIQVEQYDNIDILKC